MKLTDEQRDKIVLKELKWLKGEIAADRWEKEKERKKDLKALKRVISLYEA